MYGWEKFQDLPVGVFKWVRQTCQFNEDFMKSYYDHSDEGHFLEVDVQ